MIQITIYDENLNIEVDERWVREYREAGFTKFNSLRERERESGSHKDFGIFGTNYFCLFMDYFDDTDEMKKTVIPRETYVKLNFFYKL